MMSKTVLVCLLGLLVGSDAQILQTGQCDPNINLAANFNVANLAGIWYENARTANPTQGGDCSHIEVTISESSNTHTYYNRAVNDNFLQEFSGTLVSDSNDTTSPRLTLNLIEGNTTTPLDFWVLTTDNNQDLYALLYRCENINSAERIIYLWRLERSVVPNQLIDSFIQNTISNLFNLTLSDLEPIDHSDTACYILPTLEENEAVVLPGQCDTDISGVFYFDVQAFTGIWHQIYGYYSENTLGGCPRAEYNLVDDIVNVVNTQVANQTLLTTRGTASVIGENNSGILEVTLEVEPGVYVTQEITILETDYTNYAVAYACINMSNDTKRVFSWILGRSSVLSANVTEAVNEVVNSLLDLNYAYYQEAAQSDDDCFYYPDPVPGTPVVFRGRCDLNIPVVSDFDVARYMNLWHDIESYPSVFQQGTCNNAFYTLVGSEVDVFNTQVVNQRLDTINGVARLATDNDSAKLVVEFPVGANTSVETDYWVLSTDYDNYALVYTCLQTGDDSRTVWSWKLSRTKSLTAASSTAIDNVISTIPVLRPQYYEIKDQSVDGCFYFPEREPGVPVVFPGECDINIPGVDNFDFSSFAGIWYEIESYPRDFQVGQCVGHDWSSATENTFSLESSSVYDQFLQVSSSSVSSPDNSSRLVVTTGNVSNIPLWILATHYENYALAYSCVNIDDRPDFRAIHSWKLSRSRTLSQSATTAINAAMNDIVVLDNQYFEPVSHAEEDCFYLPELEPGEPIILPGQCDPNINVVTDFNAREYEGLWHLIESYPSDFQTGTCHDATYTIQPDETILVQNTQVVNQILDTITGSGVLIESFDNSAKLSVIFPGAENTTVEYWVLATDYISYSLVYSCVNINSEQRRVWSWKLSRSKFLSDQASRVINDAINNVNVLNQRYFVAVDNTDDACFYFPEPNGSPVVFRGQCDFSIPAVSNFNVSDYMGLWYDIESYPSIFQEGTCNNALYTLNDSSVDVFNTQVVRQRLDTINGEAIVDPEANNSGKLIVSFPTSGTNETTSTDYWVLATDYDNYALVYTCLSLGLDHRQVWSWKLSRTKQLRPEDEASINAVIATIPVLSSQYYQQRDQSEEGCFYFPEPVYGQPVIFPGHCDPNVAVHSNFSIELFEGTWHEIEAYPKDFQIGRCISHQYINGATWSIQTSSVESQTLKISASSVTFPDASTDAKMIINLGNGISIPFWVLTSNYDDYAIAYSCEELVDRPDFRTVYSWKLSRARNLSEEANAVINSVLQEVQVLDEIYFEQVDQTNSACFFYPELSPLEPVVFIGQCDVNIPVVTNFETPRFSGHWFSIESYFDDYIGECVDSTFNLSPSGGFDVLFTQVSNQTLESTSSQSEIAVDGSGRLTIYTDTESFEYWILATDYDNYALVYSCTNLDLDSRRVQSWKLSRTRSLSNSSIDAIETVVNTIDVLDERYYNVKDHGSEACFYFPEPVRGQAVRFRARCDETIQVVTNFDVERYLNLWYDIESYPQAFQGGTCADAYYSASYAGINVKNTQVVNQRLETINGTAAFDADDSTAKLLVTFPVAGTDSTITSPYWVLATDYDNYALVYSCVPVDDEYVSIGSWKLSRTQQLTSESEVAINAEIANVRVLQQQYYEPTGHTDEDCFFYPENYGGPVILEGQCPLANDISVVTNFNVAQFAGTWHEISRFPSELQTGQCANSQVTATGQTTFNLIQTLIHNEILKSISGPAVVSSDGRGIISVTLTGEEATTSLDLYVLATDYNEYALLYSCRNINEEQKQIYSWKISKSKSGLSDAANTVIDGIVSQNDDLWYGYYENTDQSNDGCFHYPEFDPLPDTITLPGPCDQRIVGKANFNTAAYLGRWFEISKYPQLFQFGECSQARYSLGDDGNLIVRNTQVINETLDVVIGSASVTSTDGSGVLEVTFVVNGVTNVANYYVLETDYTGFALVYSCRNLADGNRQVSSWKLSRSRTLTEQAVTTITNVIANTQGLIEDYYVATSLSDEDCFYVPEVIENQAPLFPGVCEHVTGVVDFNLQRYLGWWHEIYRYPVDGSVGECISSDYQQIENTLRVIDTQVDGLAGNVDIPTFTADANGKLTRTYSDGRVVESWVLATDYYIYALVYSCENIVDEFGDQYRRVWSAKHSKRRFLLPADHGFMDPIIEDNPVLHEHFFRSVDQTDAACFHYPDPALFEDGRIILPGQCRVNIPVQTQFDLDAFTGTWYQIERYPTSEISETSSCIGTRFTLNTDSEELTVLNWEVNADGNLTTTEGFATKHLQDARLFVTLPNSAGENVTTTLEILGTDYNVYALVLTCENINSFQREVVAYKLSRTRDLPISAVNPIFALTQLHEELNDFYFITTPQSDECEEPSAGVLVKSSIIVLLICAVWQMML